MNTMIAKSGKEVTFKSLSSSPMVQNKFREVLGAKAPVFIQSVVSTCQNNAALLKADPMSVFGSAIVAATLNLSVVPTLGQAALVPYNKNVYNPDTKQWEKVSLAQFQIMVRGLVQLAQRTGLYRNINTGEVYEDEFDGKDLLTGDVKFHEVKGGYRDNGDTSKIVGYFAYIETTTGFKKTEYWSTEDVVNHGKRYSKSFSTGPWKDNFPAMAKKTVLKSLLNHYGPMSADSALAQAITKDQMVNDGHGNDTYEDNALNDFLPTGAPTEESGEIIPPSTENAPQPSNSAPDEAIANEAHEEMPSFDNWG